MQEILSSWIESLIGDLLLVGAIPILGNLPFFVFS